MTGLVFSPAFQMPCEQANGYANTDSYRNPLDRARSREELAQQGADDRRGDNDREDDECQFQPGHYADPLAVVFSQDNFRPRLRSIVRESPGIQLVLVPRLP